MKFIILLLFSYGLFAAEVVVDRIVAVVNEDVVTDSDLVKYRDTFKIHKGSMPEDEYNDVLSSKLKLLNKVIDEKIISQYAQEKDMKATDEDVREAIERITRQYNMSLAQLKKQLESEGINYETFRAEKKKEIEFSKVLESEIRRTTNNSEDDVKKYFKEKTKEDVTITEYRIQALIAAKEDVCQKALAESKAGADFNDLVQKYSKDEDASSNNGDLGFLNPSELKPELKAPVLAMSIGDVRGPVKTKDGFYLIKLAEVRNIDNPHYTSNKEEIRREFMGNEINRQLSLWLERKRSESYVKINV